MRHREKNQSIKRIAWFLLGAGTVVAIWMGLTILAAVQDLKNVTD